MKHVLALVILFMAMNLPLIGCTTFLINKDGQLAFGRNYDWVTDAGLVCKNHRGLSKTSYGEPGEPTVSWVAKYGSLTFNQYGKEFPTGGMNEKGLVVELMWLDGSKYPKPDSRATLNVLQWIQYQLDNCATIDEVIATDQLIRIGADNPPLHYLVADARGQAATIEFLSGKMVMHKGKDLPIPVLTNTDYASSMKAVQNSGIHDGKEAAKFNDNSLQRFATACSMVKEFHENDSKQSIIDFSFDVLKNVSQEGWTRWSIVYDITNKAIYFKTDRFPTIKSIAFADFDFSCHTQTLAFNMNQLLSGKVSKEFKPLTKEINKQLMDRSAEESKTQVTISEADRVRQAEYAVKIACK
ncbi:MAG TPA: linear amide C-N hydrolase [Chitinophagaceae bacterium]|nr:linear amide C-N hydrolase [Chitinophagaceae bacterium]